jgi:hypothetical protein
MNNNYFIDVAIPESIIFYQQDDETINFDIVIDDPEILVRI